MLTTQGKAAPWIAVGLALVLVCAACTAATPVPIVTPAGYDWRAVNDSLYQLQRADLERISKTAYDLVVVQIGAAGGSRERIEALKHSPGGDKIVLCYVSIGQAANFAYYWQPEWHENPPAWLDEHDGTWAGDYWVHYWDSDWQAIIYGSPESYLDRVLELGFDGVYLDRVDTYEYYEERGRETAAREMADFVIGLTEYARERHPGFGVFPQNAEELGVRFPDYLEIVTGVGVEDLYYGYPRDHEPSPADWTAEREAILDQWVKAGKLVLTIDYTRVPAQIDDAYARARARGYVPFVTVRSLGLLIINEGHEPD
jgi:cysteinyl-tRNA synthetase